MSATINKAERISVEGWIFFIFDRVLFIPGIVPGAVYWFPGKSSTFALPFGRYARDEF